MASIRERRTPSGGTSFAVLFRADGRQTSITRDTLEEAETVANLVARVGGATARRILEAQKVGAAGTVTVSDLLERHIAGLSGIQPYTIATYRTMARQIAAAALGPLPAEMVDRDAVAAWVRDQEAAGVASKTIRNRHALLSAALQRAVDDNVITRNPAHRIRIARTERREMTFLTPAEFQILLARATPHYRPLLMFLFGTGMRLGEATALRKSDVHLEFSPVTVTVSRAWKKGGGLGAPKTAAGRRTISLPPQVVEALRPLMATRAAGDLLFVNMDGRRILQSTLHAMWQSWIDDTVYDRDTGTRLPRTPALGKVPRIHDLRHSHAAWMIGKGRGLHELKMRLGHESIQTTSDTYGHLLPEAQVQDERAAALAFEVAMPQIER
jgi:integrase